MRLDEIEIREVHQVRCDDHGLIGSRGSREHALALRRIHFECEHQPSRIGRHCLWRYPLGGAKPGYRLCELPAAHSGWHEDGDESWWEVGSLPREGL